MLIDQDLLICGLLRGKSVIYRREHSALLLKTVAHFIPSIPKRSEMVAIGRIRVPSTTIPFEATTICLRKMWAIILCSVMFTIFALMLFWPALGLKHGKSTWSVYPRHLRPPPHILLDKSPSTKQPTEFWQGDWVSDLVNSICGPEMLVSATCILNPLSRFVRIAVTSTTEVLMTVEHI